MNFNNLRQHWNATAVGLVALLVCGILFGGASREHALRLALVELTALPLLVIACSRLMQTDRWREHRFALSLLLALVLIPVAQIIPLPPAIWTSLPGRSDPVLALELASLRPGWNSLSLTPELTWRAALALIPPSAAFLAMLAASQTVLNRVVMGVLIAASFSVALGALQLASGGERLYPWETTSVGSVSGFFANRNHLASLLLASIPFATILGAASLRRRRSTKLPIWLSAIYLAVVVVSLAAIRSRAGVILVAPVLLTSLLAAWIASGRGKPRLALLAFIGATGIALTAVAALALPPILARFDVGASSEGRFREWPIVADAAQSYLPLGSGIGSFDTVHRSVEPLDQLDSTFFNQAHNDYLELWLETGWIGISAILLFFIWYGRRTLVAWRSGSSSDHDLQRASSIAIGVFLLHSFVDYPLRTSAGAILFAIFCGILELATRSIAASQELHRTRQRS